MKFKCFDCHDTGKIELLTSTVPCDCLSQPVVDNDYANAVSEINLKWMDYCCSCHISPPCGFCLRYAEADVPEPEYCDTCCTPFPNDKECLHECPMCGKFVCEECCSKNDTVCFHCMKPG